jgi:hypothetical protein
VVRLLNATVNTLTHNQLTVKCDVLIDSGQSDTQLMDGIYGVEVLTDSGQTIEGSSEQSDTEPIDGTV